MGAIRLFEVWLLIGLMVLSGGSIAFAQTNTFPSSGSVGIGTSSPSSAFKLDIQGTPGVSAGDAHFRVYSTSATNTSYGAFVMSNSTGRALYITLGDSGITADYLARPGDGVLATTVGAGLAINTNSTENNGIYINTSGSVGIGLANPTSRLHVSGDARITGNVTADGNIAAKYQDVAEWVPAKNSLPAGTVVVIDPLQGNGVLPASQAYDTRVAGVVSPQPGILLGEEGENKVKVAHSGRVRVKVDARYGAIGVGDLLVTSSTSGEAMRSNPVDVNGVPMHRPGTIIGKALEPLTEGESEILVLLTLQ